MAVLRLTCSGEVRATYPLAAPVVVIGRGSACDIRLSGAGVSRSHCQIAKEGDGHVVRDLGSSNGTYVNGVAVRERELRDGDKIFVCPHVLRYDAGAPAPADDDEYLATMHVDSGEIRGLLKELGRPGQGDGGLPAAPRSRGRMPDGPGAAQAGK
jgi:pSer/pThr/pTyr-binding forkhead associated (FHA) protein